MVEEDGFSNSKNSKLGKLALLQELARQESLLRAQSSALDAEIAAVARANSLVFALSGAAKKDSDGRAVEFELKPVLLASPAVGRASLAPCMQCALVIDETLRSTLLSKTQGLTLHLVVKVKKAEPSSSFDQPWGADREEWSLIHAVQVAPSNLVPTKIKNTELPETDCRGFEKEKLVFDIFLDTLAIPLPVFVDATFEITYNHANQTPTDFSQDEGLVEESPGVMSFSLPLCEKPVLLDLLHFASTRYPVSCYVGASVADYETQEDWVAALQASLQTSLPGNSIEYFTHTPSPDVSRYTSAVHVLLKSKAHDQCLDAVLILATGQHDFDHGATRRQDNFRQLTLHCAHASHNKEKQCAVVRVTAKAFLSTSGDAVTIALCVLPTQPDALAAAVHGAIQRRLKRASEKQDSGNQNEYHIDVSQLPL